MIGKNHVIVVIATLFWLHKPVLSQPMDSTSLAQTAAQAYAIFLSNPDSSIHLIDKSLPHVIAGKHKSLEGHYYFILSKANWTKANYRLSIEFGFKALKIFEESDEITIWGQTLVSLARTFIDLRNYDQAKLYLDRANTLAKRNNNKELQADVYREQSMFFSATNHYDSALFYADKGLDLFQQWGDSLSISILYGRKAKVYFNQGDYKKSAYFNRISMRLDSLVGNLRALGFSYFQMAQNAYYLKKTDSAILLLKKAIPINNKIENLSGLIAVHKLLATIYEETKKPELAVVHLKLASQYKDSLYNAEKNGQIQEMQSLYELETKDNTILSLEHENELNQAEVKNQQILSILLSVGLLLLGSLILVLIRLRRIQARANRTLTTQNKDIEQQKEEIQTQAESLQQLNHLKSKLFSVISHDLRGPIHNLQALLELLTNQSLNPDEFVTVSDKLKGNLNLTQRTLENLLSWSLSQMDGLRTDPKPTALRNIFDDTCTLMEEVGQRKNITLEKNCPLTIIVLADTNQLQLILRNLVHNAIKFSKANGKVLVSAAIDSTFCTISVKDFGMGMTNREIEMILGSNEHFTKMGTHQEKGTGLGLLLCKEFIQRNGGNLSISSVPGVGTDVSFTLPLSF